MESDHLIILAGVLISIGLSLINMGRHIINSVKINNLQKELHITKGKFLKYLQLIDKS